MHVVKYVYYCSVVLGIDVIFRHSTIVCKSLHHESHVHSIELRRVFSPRFAYTYGADCRIDSERRRCWYAMRGLQGFTYNRMLGTIHPRFCPMSD